LEEDLVTAEYSPNKVKKIGINEKSDSNCDDVKISTKVL
jgi:hypothetical protein